MRTVFIADAHLSESSDSNYARLLKFLDELRGTTETLCIMGDLFDFRIGLKSLEFPEHEPVLDALSALSSSGTRIIYLEGNHDFHLGAGFARRIGAELHRGPVVKNLHGLRLLLCHGDLINRADIGYRFLHLLIRNRLAGAVGCLLPAGLLTGIRKRLQHASRRSYRAKEARWDYCAIIRQYAESLASKGAVDGLVVGHFHIAYQEQVGRLQVLSLGDWIGQFTYGLLEDKTFKLLTY
jgi:UDP-2,3-diacylglucosamine hydrolase